MEAAELGYAGPWRSKGLTIEFSDLIFKAGGKVILNGVSGRFRSGHLSAVMGPSGAGKTSLLNILSGFTPPSQLEGTITLDGEPRDLSKLRQQLCYITQEFSMLEYLSVRETMHIAANLKLGPTVGNEKKNIVIDDVAPTSPSVEATSSITIFFFSFPTVGPSLRLAAMCIVSLTDRYSSMENSCVM
uniref:ABC transporter domain-containing protein n=1 Tax=Homalodisca liturata TaxID=320908 RepID=A0A1B6K7M8_9HEMI